MPTKNPRFNVTFDPATAMVLASLAKREHKSMAHVTRELVQEALERREDMALSKIAEKRDTKKAKTVKHKDVWK